jgi:hypothetical protein
MLRNLPKRPRIVERGKTHSGRLKVKVIGPTIVDNKVAPNENTGAGKAPAQERDTEMDAPDPLKPVSPELPQRVGLYATPEEALKKVSSEFEYWSGKLTETSLQMCYALIGADWVVFGSVNGILNSGWAKSSLVMVLLALGTNVVGAWMLSESLRRRIAYGEGALSEWATEFEVYRGKDVSWPFTDEIQNTGKYMRWIKAGFTLVSGVLLIIGAIVKS